MFVNIQSSWVRNINTHMVGCSQIINDDIHIVQNKYKQFDCICGETVCAYWSWTHIVSNKYKQFHHIHGQTVCAYWSWTHSVSNKYKQFHHVHSQTVCAYWSCSWLYLIENNNEILYWWCIGHLSHSSVQAHLAQLLPSIMLFILFIANLSLQKLACSMQFSTSAHAPCNSLWVHWVYKEKTHLLPLISMKFSVF